MSAINTERLDFVVQQAKIVLSGLEMLECNPKMSLLEVIIISTSYFTDDESVIRKYSRDSKELDNELHNWFVVRPESKLQDRYANHLIDVLLKIFKPVYIRLHTQIDLYVKHSTYNRTEEGETLYLYSNDHWCRLMAQIVEHWIYVVRKNVKTFAPELYKEHSYTLDRLLPIYDEEGNENEHLTGQPQPTGPVVKLQWNGAANTLYDVFRQLKNHHLPKGETLIEDGYDQIARFIQQSFVGFDEVATSTIRGELTKNNRPKKSFNRKDLDLTEPD